jgi:hypothetical protein
VLLLIVTALVATVAFGVGAAVEKATLTTSPAVTASHETAGETAGSSEASGTSTVPAGEMILGFNPESLPLIVGAIVGSLALAGGIWLYWRRPIVVWTTAVAMAAFAVLDIVELVHQVAEQHPALVATAALVALLHGTAAVLAIRLVRSNVKLETVAA